MKKDKYEYKIVENERRETIYKIVKIRNAIDSLNEMIEMLRKETVIKENIIKEMQLKCKKHEWIDDGYDSHHRYKKCSKCGKTKSD